METAETQIRRDNPLLYLNSLSFTDYAYLDTHDTYTGKNRVQHMWNKYSHAGFMIKGKIVGREKKN